jgi:hypothetical protein
MDNNKTINKKNIKGVKMSEWMDGMHRKPSGNHTKSINTFSGLHSVDPGGHLEMWGFSE